MSEEDNKILKYHQGEKSMKVPFIIYADLESLLEKINTCHNKPEKLSTTKTNKYFYFKNNIFYFPKHVSKFTYFIVSCTN